MGLEASLSNGTHIQTQTLREKDKWVRRGIHAGFLIKLETQTNPNSRTL